MGSDRINSVSSPFSVMIIERVAKPRKTRLGNPGQLATNNRSKLTLAVRESMSRRVEGNEKKKKKKKKRRRNRRGSSKGERSCSSSETDANGWSPSTSLRPISLSLSLSLSSMWISFSLCFHVFFFASVTGGFPELRPRDRRRHRLNRLMKWRASPTSRRRNYATSNRISLISVPGRHLSADRSASVWLKKRQKNPKNPE